jgi:hypothetical protein
LHGFPRGTPRQLKQPPRGPASHKLST